MDNIVEINNKIFLKGNFEGMYQADSFSEIGNARFSKIHIIEGTFEKVKVCNFNNLFNINEDSLYYTDLINLEVKLDDDVLDEKYLFLEEFHNTTFYNINLSDQLQEGNATFGVIKAEMICSLDDTMEVQIVHDNSFEITKEIDFESTFFAVEESNHDDAEVGLFNTIKRISKNIRQKISLIFKKYF